MRQPSVPDRLAQVAPAPPVTLRLGGVLPLPGIGPDAAVRLAGADETSTALSDGVGTLGGAQEPVRATVTGAAEHGQGRQYTTYLHTVGRTGGARRPLARRARR